MTWWFSEPGFWAVAILIGLALVQAIGAAFARPKFAELLSLVDAVRHDPKANAVDQAWLDHYIEAALDRRMPVMIAAVAPIAVAVAIPGMLLELRSGPDTDKTAEAMLEAGVRALILEDTGEDPRRGNLWNDQRRRRIDELAAATQALSSPIASLVIAASLVLLLPFMFMATAPIIFAKNLSGELRTVVLRAAALQQGHHH